MTEVCEPAPFTFIWTIENFSPRSCSTITSPSFIVGFMRKTKWHLEIKERNEQEGYCCFISRDNDKNKGPRTIEIYFELAVLADDGSVLTAEKGQGIFKKRVSISNSLEMEDSLWQRWMKVSSRNILTIRCKM
ncbi:hypothetical protein CEXT_71521 [Caerostris extrusa]|uniref:MATH domain-containing protein n=1 Tax=Caerostris extrusa TaxID=172846 RepID=A0AAV4Y3R7_CAEEX|nr:hypothetical protein CEXT_71521 [Caerostris extrusa]